ncbi:MAG: O-antigen ligase family protein [Lewinellaceae bacterium]|nr:O-antigen ligase family protein [Lewinellaceae bacterium]
MKSSSFTLEKISRILWALALIAIPVTSFRWFPLLGESRTLVRPLAMYPLGLLFQLLLFQAWRGTRKLTWASAFVPLGAFVLFVITSSSIGLLTNPIPLYSQDYTGRTVRALVTMSIGLIFFFSAAWMNTSEDDFRFSIKYLLVGLCLNIAWSGLQATAFYTSLIEKDMLTQWQLAFSMRQLDNTRRISGLAFEPAWLAGQLATIYIPILFAAVLTNFRLTLNRWLEPVLLALSLLLLLATYSRGGLLVTLAGTGITFLIFGRGVMRSMWTWFINGFRSRVFDALIRVGMIAAILAALGGSILFLSQRNIFRNLLTANTDSLTEYIVGINAGGRGAYSAGAWAAYEKYPFTGAGFGASGLYIYQNLPDWSLTTLPEIARQQSPENRLYPNPKNIYIRLFAETGIIGFFLYLAFQLYLLGDALSISLQKQPWARFAAIAGVCAWLGITFYNFTQDSFAMPNLWLVTGIMVGLSAYSTEKPALTEE